MVNKQHGEEDRLCIEAWISFLAEFHEIQKNYNGKKDNEKLIQLKEKAKVNPHLTYRQLEGINARCDNVINGVYGNTKTEDNFNHSKPSKKVA